jgi:UDP-N-acetylmuramyl tripeptide synthase
MLGAKMALAGVAGKLARWSGRGGGTSLPGKILTQLEPNAIASLAGRLREGTVVISATNGKTTSSAMVAAILRTADRKIVHNRTGANMPGGIASTLAAAARHGGKDLGADLGLFEIDELWLAPLAEQLDPHAMLLGNLFRDQLDRCGELETIAQRWTTLAAERSGRTRVVACADDPLVAGIGAVAPDTFYFGVEDGELARSELQHASDSTHCRGCGRAFAYTAAYLAHLGHWHCDGCSSARPTPQMVATDVKLHGSRATSFTLRTGTDAVTVELPFPGLYNVYNALGAAALCLVLGMDLPQIVAGLAAVEPAFGRAETFELDGHPVSLLLVKNPAGANEVVRTLSLEDGELELFGVLNDRIADGRDVSWIWDIDWELIVPKVRHVTCAGTRAADLAVRLKHAGVTADRLHLAADVKAGLDGAVARANSHLYVLPTYTAMLELQDVLASRGETKEFWR